MAGRYDHDFPLLPSTKHGKKRKGAAAKETTCTPMNAITTINDLPDELILEILVYLPGIDEENFQLPTLASLSRVNHRFHRIVAKGLFYSYDSQLCKPYLFLRTVSSNRQLAELVQHADISYDEWASSEQKWHVASAQDKKIVKEGMRALNIPGWKGWATNCNTADIGIETLHSAVLMHTPNLKSLLIRSTHASSHHNAEWLALIKRAATGAPYGNAHRFEHLHSVNVDASSFSVSELAPLFRLPALRDLVLRDLVAITMDKENITSEMERLLPPHSSQLEKLEFELSWIDMDILSILVASPRRLKTLKLELTMNSIAMPISYDYENVWGSAKLCELLCAQKSSLETLWIVNDRMSEAQNFYALYLDGMPRDFLALKDLHCPLSILMRGDSNEPPAFFETLPPTLVSFHSTIRRGTDDSRSLRHLEELAANFSPNTSQLKEVTFHAPLRAEWFTYDWKALTKSFAAVNISLTVVQDENEGLFDEAWNMTNWSESSDEVSLYSDED